MHMSQNYDDGIGSCGWALLQTTKYGAPFKIIALGAIVFPNGETPRGDTVTASRRARRHTRRPARRKRFRKYRIKRLFINDHLLTKRQIKRIFRQKPMPSIYQLRVQGLKHALSIPELFQVLYYFGGHRSFHSSRKYALSSKKAGVMLKAIHQVEAKLKNENYTTVGQMLATSPKFKHQKRNKGYDNGYRFMASRSMIVKEAILLLHVQQSFHSWLTDAFIKHYLHLLTAQRDFDKGPSKPSPFAGSQIKKMIGSDSLDETQQRGAKGTYTFEYFQLLSKLNTLKIQNPSTHKWHRLTQAQRNKVVKLCFKSKKVTYKQIAKLLKLPTDIKFNLINYGNYKSIKSANNAKFNALKAIHEISACLPKSSQANHKLIDKIGTILSIYSSDDTRTNAFNKINLSSTTISKLLSLNYSGFSKLSLRTMRNLIPYLEQGCLYSDSARKAGYNFSHKVIDDAYIHNNINNPVVLRSFTINKKLCRALTRKYGKPDTIHIELARDLNKPYSVRMKIQKTQKKNVKRNQEAINWLTDYGYNINGNNILIYNLYKEQHGIDPYTDQKIDIVKALSGNGNFYNIDHIIPYSWTFDDSFNNKVLTSTKANEDKANRLPLQYLSKAQQPTFISYVKKDIKNYRKRENLLKTDMSKDELSAWKSRNLNDTRYITKLIANYFQQNVDFKPNKYLGKRRVITSNGSMTEKLLHRWGLRKVREDGDLHHTQDAVVIGCCVPSLIRYINQFSKYKEIRNNPKLYKPQYIKQLGHKVLSDKLYNKFINAFPLPWHDFRNEVIGRLSTCPTKFMLGRPWKHYTKAEIMNLHQPRVVHLYKHTINGQVCKDTLRSNKYTKDGYVMSRYNLKKLKLTKKGIIKSGFYKYLPKKNQSDQVLYHKLLAHLKAHHGNGKKAFPDGCLKYRDKTNHLHIVHRVKLYKHSTSGLPVNHGTGLKDIGKIVRIDVFFNQKKHKYEYVPIYLYQVLDKHLPNVIASSGKKTKYLSKDDTFKFSLDPYTPVHVIFKKPRRIDWLAKYHSQQKVISDFYGYYLKPNVHNGAIYFVSYDRSFGLFNSGMGTIKSFQKMTINYLGNIHLVHQKRRLPFNFKHK